MKETKHSRRTDLAPLSVSLTPVPWCKMRFSADNEEIIGKNKCCREKRDRAGSERGNAVQALKRHLYLL